MDNNIVEITKNHPTESRQRLCIQSLLHKGVDHHHLHVAETERQAEEWKSFVVEKKRGFRRDQIGGCWHGEAGEGLSRSGASCVIC